STLIAFATGSVLFSLFHGGQIRAQSSQSIAASTPSFDVASVKPSRSGENSSFLVAPNRLSVRNQPVDFIIKFAYGRDLGEFGFSNLRDNQLLGGPSWVRSKGFGYEGYDVE